MNYLDNFAVLNNGLKIPNIAIGTWQLNNEQTYNSIKLAIKNGYRHIDTAIAYDNEKGVGKAIKDSKVSREKIFVTTKIPAEIKSYKETEQSFYKSLENLGLDYIDSLLIHAPKPWDKMFCNSENYDKENVEVWNFLEKVYKDGKVKSIGVSNFNINDIDNIIKNCVIKPMVNQVRFFIGFYQKDLFSYCKQNNILLSAHSTLLGGKIFENDNIKNVATKCNCTIAQLCIKYALEKNVVPIFKTTKENRMIENIKLDFDIKKEYIDILDDLNELK